jgi:hypothetical protein
MATLRRVALAALAGAAFLVWTAPDRSLAAVAAEMLEISARPITEFQIGSSEIRFGPLEFVGGLELTSPSRDFGSMSAIRFTDGGNSFAGVADTGSWFFGRILRDEDGRPVGFGDFRLAPILDADGVPLGSKQSSDAEGLAVKDGVATASFEREHRISEYRLDSQVPSLLKNVDFLVPAFELRRNRGFETITYAPADGPLQGARVAIAEGSIDEAGNIFAAVLEGPEKGVFTVAHDGYEITDGVFLPDGDLLLLERSFSILEGVAMQLRRIEAETIGAGKLADGPVLLEADMGYQIDNMEGIDVWRRDDGALMVSLVSDDNQSILQRNLYLEFRLVE